MARAPATEVVHLDTHIVCWLYEGRTDLLSETARDAVERGQLGVSPIVDVATIRRGMVDAGLVTRDGGAYRRGT